MKKFCLSIKELFSSILEFLFYLYRFILVGLCLLVGACTGFEYYLRNFRDPNEINKNQYNSYLLTFSALSNTRYLLGHADMATEDEKRLCSIDSITLFFVIMEFVGRSYVLPIFYGMINIKRALNGLTDQYFTAKKFFFIRGSSFAVCTYVLARFVISYEKKKYRLN